ncbi:MAG: glycosyltransferase [Chloroflexi bacterium]|nr:glycosyltransferase [Chloroflexota bacterium]
MLRNYPAAHPTNLNILYLVPYAPTPIRTRPYNLIRALASRGHQVTVATLWENEDERLFLESLADKDIRVISAPLTRFQKIINLLTALPTQLPLQANYCWQPQLVNRISEQWAAGGRQWDIVHIEHLRGAKYGLQFNNKNIRVHLRSSASHFSIPIVWDSVDCISYLFEQAAQGSQDFFGRRITRLDLPRTRKFEGHLIHHFDRVLVTSQIDKDALEQLSPISQKSKSSSIVHHPPFISVLPNGVNLNYFAPDPLVRREPATLVVTGKMSYHANIAMVKHLYQDIMPLVWASQPDVKLWIVGKDPSRDIQALGQHPLVFISGTVEDVRPYLHGATLAVAPVTYGAGIQNKVLEAMACSTPVVAGRKAVAALDIEHGVDGLVVDAPREFADAILTLLSNPEKCAQIGRSGRLYTETHHNWHHLAEQLEGIYHEVIHRHNCQDSYTTHS